MDRRRFAPKAENLEGRQLLSFFGNTNKFNNYNTTAYAIEITRNMRIDRLPGYLGSLQPGAFATQDVVQNLEGDLQAIESQLTPAPSAVLNQFNQDLRSTIPHASLSASDAAQLNQDFGNILGTSGANPQVTAKFQVDMNDLAREAVDQKTSAILASNDYAVVSQMVQGIGVPMRAPAAPTLLPQDSLPPRRDQITTKSHPRVYGNYDLGTTVQILDQSDQVLGSASVASTGRYVVTISTPLAPGTYTLRARAVNNLNGNISYSSAPLTITVVTPPQGPVKAARVK
jgi:hypothetical protein